MSDPRPAASSPNRDELIRQGISAAQGGRLTEARAIFERATVDSGADAQTWVMLAQVYRMQADQEAEEKALDEALKLQSRQLQALLLKGDARARAGDDRAATSFYQLAIGVATGSSAVPQALFAHLDRAHAYLAEAGQRFEAHLRDSLAKAGIDSNVGGRRFHQAIEILCGRSQLYFQQPTAFFYPGLPQIQFYDRADFPWVGALESATDAIRAELNAVLASQRDGFTPYVEALPERPRSSSPLFDDPRWGALYLWKNGNLVPENSARFPRTIDTLASADIPRIAGRSPMALFSRLRPGTHIPPHHGLLNTRLICHLPVIVPDGCRLRVGNETRAWTEGEMLIFDDSFEHEAWNDSAQTRVVLLFEIWRPELSVEEREALTLLYQSIDLYGADADMA